MATFTIATLSKMSMIEIMDKMNKMQIEIEEKDLKIKQEQKILLETRDRFDLIKEEKNDLKKVLYATQKQLKHTIKIYTEEE
tara:strand:- start:1330 stop:1575 length:246 start_codon:yes stop_codon:yes gene_type:complete